MLVIFRAQWFLGLVSLAGDALWRAALAIRSSCFTLNCSADQNCLIQLVITGYITYLSICLFLYFCAYYYSNCLYKNDLYFTVTGLVCSAFLKKLSKKANNIKEQILSIELEEHSKYTIF